MTDLKAEAIKLIEQMPEDELERIMATLRAKATPVDPVEKRRKAQEAFQRLQKYIGRLPANFDYKKELEASMAAYAELQKYRRPNAAEIDYKAEYQKALEEKYADIG